MALFLVLIGSCRADLITIAPVGGTTITWPTCGSFCIVGLGQGVTVSTDGNTVTFNPPAFSVAETSSGDFNFGFNGNWSSLNGAYSNNLHGDMLFSFETAVSSVGGFMTYAPRYQDGTGSWQGPHPVITAWLSDGTFEFYDFLGTEAEINCGISSLNCGAYRGIQRSSADIIAFEVSGPAVAVHDLTFDTPTTAVPEPSTFLLLASGLLLGIGRLSRKDV